jgi:hypothetical protein
VHDARIDREAVRAILDGGLYARVRARNTRGAKQARTKSGWFCRSVRVGAMRRDCPLTTKLLSKNPRYVRRSAQKVSVDAGDAGRPSVPPSVLGVRLGKKEACELRRRVPVSRGISARPRGLPGKASSRHEELCLGWRRAHEVKRCSRDTGGALPKCVPDYRRTKGAKRGRLCDDEGL